MRASKHKRNLDAFNRFTAFVKYPIGKSIGAFLQQYDLFFLGTFYMLKFKNTLLDTIYDNSVLFVKAFLLSRKPSIIWGQ